MKQQSMKVLFYLNKAKTNQMGVCPIYCRITYLKERKQFSTGQFVNPKFWNSKQQAVFNNDLLNDLVNKQLLLIKQKLKTTYLMLQLNHKTFSVEDIFNSYFGKSIKKEETVLNCYNRYLIHIKRLIGKDIKKPTYQKFEYVLEFIKAYIKFKFHKKDIPLKVLDIQFLNDFEYYLRTEKNLSPSTINKVIQRFRKPIKIAISEGYLTTDPFMLYKAKHVKKEVIFLTPDELKKLEKHKFSQPRLTLVQDLFVFSCYTGLAYNELSKLNRDHIIKGFDNNFWIQMKREKTDKLFSVPLLPKPLLLIKKHKNLDSKIFPVISNQKYNSYLKEVSDIVGIDKKLTTHTARKTFASTVLLYNDVPMEIVSELLGHSSLKITQDSYGKIVQKKISEEMLRLNKMFLN